jgi:DNA-binding transcriptional LysR family regulator
MLERVLVQAEQEIALSSEDMFGPLAIGGTPGALMSILPSAIAAIEAKGIRAAFKVIQATDSELNEALRNLSIDLAICTVGVGSLPPDIVEHTIAEDRFVVVMRADHPLADSKAELEKLADADWVLPSDGGAFQRQIEAMFLSAGVRIPTHGVRSDALAITREIIRCSNHLTIAPIEMVRSDLDAGILRAIPLASAMPLRSAGIRLLRDRRQTEIAELLIEEMKSASRYQSGL